jgi:hypothetical protein
MTDRFKAGIEGGLHAGLVHSRCEIDVTGVNAYPVVLYDDFRRPNLFWQRCSHNVNARPKIGAEPVDDDFLKRSLKHSCDGSADGGFCRTFCVVTDTCKGKEDTFVDGKQP